MIREVRPLLRQWSEVPGSAVAPDGRVAARLGAVTAKVDIWNVCISTGPLEIVVLLVSVYSLTSGDCDAATGQLANMRYFGTCPIRVLAKGSVETLVYVDLNEAEKTCIPLHESWNRSKPCHHWVSRVSGDPNSEFTKLGCRNLL